MRLLKNKTEEDLILTDGSPSISIPANDEFDLSVAWKPHQIAESDQLVEALGQGIDKYQLNDGTDDLSVAAAIDLVRGYWQRLPLSPDGRTLQAQVRPTQGSSAILVTHNFCDPCTWFGDSVRITEEVLSDLGDHIHYRSDHKNWIDLTHWRLTHEDNIINDTESWPNGPFTVLVTVDDVVQVEGQDYKVDYESGELRFRWISCHQDNVWFGAGPLNPGAVVKATYNYANGSTYYLRPAVGKILRIVKTEVQFTQDVLIRDTMIWQTWVYNPYDLPNKVPYGAPVVYKGAKDYIAEGNQGTGTIQPFGGTVRGMHNKVSVFPFDYVSSKDLPASAGAEIRCQLKNHLPMIGEWGTATMYTLSEDEE